MNKSLNWEVVGFGLGFGEKTGVNTGTRTTTAREGGGPVFTGAAATGAKSMYIPPTTTQMREKHMRYTWSGLKPAAPARSRS